MITGNRHRTIQTHSASGFKVNFSNNRSYIRGKSRPAVFPVFSYRSEHVYMAYNMNHELKVHTSAGVLGFSPLKLFKMKCATCEEWLKKCDNHIYRNSVFYKGPLLLLSNTIELNLSPASFLTLRAYKNNVKYAILKTQSIGDKEQWGNENFILYNIKGLRKSKTEYRNKINYSEL